MAHEPTWQAQAVDQLSQTFRQDPDAKAFILGGSLADPETQEDAWSDVDAAIILADQTVDRYYLTTAWLSPLGRLVGAERHEDHLTKTLRVCLEGLHRFDLLFIAESTLHNPSLWDRNPFHPSYVVVWSEVPDLETYIALFPAPTVYQDTPREEIEGLVDAFWLKASVAIVKVVRSDLLIGLHLALDLARDCLVLQMIRRDREKRTTIHRTGGWGNELATRIAWDGQEGAGEDALNLITRSCEVFDELASELLPGTDRRGPLLLPIIEAARQVCRGRARQ